MFSGLCSLLLSNRHKSPKSLILVVLGGVGLVVLILGIMFVTNTKSLFSVAMIVAGIIFLGLVFLYRHLVPSVVVFLVFLILGIGTYNVMTADAESEVIKSRRSNNISDCTNLGLGWFSSPENINLLYNTSNNNG